MLYVDEMNAITVPDGWMESKTVPAILKDNRLRSFFNSEMGLNVNVTFESAATNIGRGFKLSVSPSKVLRPGTHDWEEYVARYAKEIAVGFLGPSCRPIGKNNNRNMHFFWKEAD